MQPNNPSNPRPKSNTSGSYLFRPNGTHRDSSGRKASPKHKGKRLRATVLCLSLIGYAVMSHCVMTRYVPCFEAVGLSVLSDGHQTHLEPPWPGFPWPQATDPFPGSASWSAIFLLQPVLRAPRQSRMMVIDIDECYDISIFCYGSGLWATSPLFPKHSAN